MRVSRPGRTRCGAAQLVPEAGTTLFELGADGVVQHSPRWVERLDRRRERRELVGEVQPDPTVVRAEPSCANPHDVARVAQVVEVGRAIAGQAGREQFGLQGGRHYRSALQLAE